MTQTPLSYSYKPKVWLLVISICFFVPFVYLFIWMAQTNDEGLRLILIRHIAELTLSPYEATLFYWGFAFLMFGVLSIFLIGLYNSFTSMAKIIITSKDIGVPSSMFNTSKSVTIPFNQILSVEVLNVFSVRLAKIIHQKGKITFSEKLLPTKTAFDEILQILEKHKVP